MALWLFVAACGGRGLGHRDAGLEVGGLDGAAGADGAAGTGVDGDAGAQDATADLVLTTTVPVAWVGMRQLTDAEYDNTIRDLLGVSTTMYRTLAGPEAEGAGDFDTFAAGQTISPPRYQGLFASTVGAVQAAFANPTLRARVVTCAPASPTDEVCARNTLSDFGLRAWRRRLATDEVDGLLRVVRDAWTTGGADFHGGLQQGVIALLVSEAFLFRVELDPDPNGSAIHAVDPFDLATRLSYLVWSSTPDITLQSLAGTGHLLEPATLTSQVNRLLADPRADGFVRDFAGQWLDFRRLDGAAISWWPANVQRAAYEEALRFVDLIVEEDRPLTELLTADVNFVDAALAAHYGFAAPATPAVTRVSVTTDARKGVLGLVAPLARTSSETWTSPTKRGLFVLERFLCQDIATGPDCGITPSGANPRERADALAAQPACAECHSKFDPVGFGLEGFDNLGRSRAFYTNDAPIDGKGRLDGVAFDGVPGLADRLAADPRFPRCAARKAISYALGRRLLPADDATVDRIAGAFQQKGLTVRGLLSAIVTDDVFRFRRGEGQP